MQWHFKKLLKLYNNRMAADLIFILSFIYISLSHLGIFEQFKFAGLKTDQWQILPVCAFIRAKKKNKSEVRA